ncbi:MAG TPA: hypothetical protein VFR50_10245 [Casimicrobiaceae bacterium]|jgi:hypothetical protein|nr:hypothetical protein [Casimicrobiaceae bacterium]
MQTTTLALEHLLCAIGDPVRELSEIGPGHPDFVRAQTIRAGAGVLAKAPEALPAIARAVRTTAPAALSPRARSHLAAAEAWVAGDPLLAAESYAFILSRWPTDLLALRLAQSCYFFLGRHARLCEVVDGVATSWTDDQRGFRLLLAMASFAYAESGDPAQAEALGRDALAYEPGCPMGVHAVAHAFAESGRHREGARWMREQRGHWETESRMRTHNAWHLAMFDAEQGQVESALAILDGSLLPACAASPLDACDAVGLLWRLVLAGVDPGERWRALSDAFEHATTPGFWPYIDLHAAFAHHQAGSEARAQRLADAIERCAGGVDYAALRARLVTQPGLEALGAWADGRYAEAARMLSDLQRFIGDAGGSRVQLELFHSVEREAARLERALPQELIAA